MCFTDKPTKPGVTNPERSMQIFSVKVEEIYGDLHWPLDVFGIVAVRDDLDHHRNIIFERKRDNCQTLNEEVFISHIHYVLFVSSSATKPFLITPFSVAVLYVPCVCYGFYFTTPGICLILSY